MSDKDKRSDRKSAKRDRARHPKPPPYDPDPRIITEFERARREPKADRK